MLVHQPSAIALPGKVTLISVGPNGEQGIEHAGIPLFVRAPSISSDGSKVAFVWGYTGLYPDDYAGDPDDIAHYLYVKNVESGELVLAIRARWVEDPELAKGGTRVVFSSDDPSVFPSDPAVTQDVYVRDLVSGQLLIASTNAAGVRADNGAGAPSLSADGTRVVFASPATNLHPADTDSTSDVYAKDLISGAVVLVSTNGAGTKGNGGSFLPSSPQPSISADGTKVAFVSEASNLDTADALTDSDVYVKDLASGALTLASTTATGEKLDGSSVWPTISSAGSKVAFLFVPSDSSDTDPGRGLYVKDLGTGALTKVSSDGHSPSISSDGNRVAFLSLAELDPAIDLPGEGFAYYLVYVRDVSAGLTAAVSTDAAGALPHTYSFDPGITDDGKQVVFYTHASNLDPVDQDSNSDVFVKQVPDPFPTATTRPGIRQDNEWIMSYGFKYYPDVRFTFAKASDRPVVGDWDGDGTWTVGAVRGNQWFLTNETPPQTIGHSFAFAKASDRVVVGDWDGDGDMTPGVVRGNTWYLTNQLPPSSISATFTFAKATDRPIVGDWDGDGVWTPGVVRGNTWYLTNEIPPSSIATTFAFGKASDTPITGDWNGDGTFTPGVFRAGAWPHRPEWFLATRLGGPVDINFTIYKSHPADDPLAGDWNGGGI